MASGLITYIYILRLGRYSRAAFLCSLLQMLADVLLKILQIKHGDAIIKEKRLLEA